MFFDYSILGFLLILCHGFSLLWRVDRSMFFDHSILGLFTTLAAGLEHVF